MCNPSREQTFARLSPVAPDPSPAAPPMPTVTSRCCIAHPPCSPEENISLALYSYNAHEERGAQYGRSHSLTVWRKAARMAGVLTVLNMPRIADQGVALMDIS